MVSKTRVENLMKRARNRGVLMPTVCLFVRDLNGQVWKRKEGQEVKSSEAAIEEKAKDPRSLAIAIEIVGRDPAFSCE